jgi:FkbM family methyltransferase
MAIRDSLIGFLVRNNIRGKDRLLTLFKKTGINISVLFKAKYGISLYLNPYEYIDNIILKENFYESEITDEIIENLRDGGTFWDVGTNIGIHSIAVKKNLPAVNVYSFEPNPKTLARLYDNVKLNKLDIKMCSFALFENAGCMTLHLMEGNSGMTTLTPWYEIKFDSSVECLTITGDKLLTENFKIPNVIKLDTEGSELFILKGCINILSSPELKLILIEANNDLSQNSGSDEIAVFLRKYGFNQIKLLPRNENTSHGLSNFAISRTN